MMFDRVPCFTAHTFHRRDSLPQDAPRSFFALSSQSSGCTVKIAYITNTFIIGQERVVGGSEPLFVYNKNIICIV